MSRIVFSHEQIKDMISLYNDGISTSKIAEKYNVSKTKIIETLHENGISYRRDRFSKEEEKRACELYRIYQNGSTVGKMMNRNHHAIIRVVRRNGIDVVSNEKVQQHYTLDEEYFDKIDSNNKAYILGLLCADGCLSKDDRHTISIALQDTDKDILTQINATLKSNRPLSFRNMKQRKESYHNQYCLTITNKHMWTALNELGVTPNKSLTLKYPNIDDKYQKSFILGYLDGDGCIYKGYNKVSFLGTEDFIKVLNRQIEKFVGFSGKIYDTASNSITKSLEIYGKYKAPAFLSWLYKDETMFIQRKKQIYLDRYVNNSLLDVAI